MLLIMQSEMTQESTGYAILSTSTESFAVSLLLGRNAGDCVERDTATTSNDLLAEQTGRETTLSHFAATVDSGCRIMFIITSCLSFYGHSYGGNISGYLELQFWMS